jgi:hypothetical protein
MEAFQAFYSKEISRGKLVRDLEVTDKIILEDAARERSGPHRLEPDT